MPTYLCTFYSVLLGPAILICLNGFISLLLCVLMCVLIISIFVHMYACVSAETSCCPYQTQHCRLVWEDLQQPNPCDRRQPLTQFLHLRCTCSTLTLLVLSLLCLHTLAGVHLGGRGCCILPPSWKFLKPSFTSSYVYPSSPLPSLLLQHMGFGVAGVKYSGTHTHAFLL